MTNAEDRKYKAALDEIFSHPDCRWCENRFDPKCAWGKDFNIECTQNSHCYFVPHMEDIRNNAVAEVAKE